MMHCNFISLKLSIKYFPIVRVLHVSSLLFILSFLCQIALTYSMDFDRKCSFALTSSFTGWFSEKILQHSCWELLYLKLSIFPRGASFIFFSKMAYIWCNLWKIRYSWVCDVILTGLGSTLLNLLQSEARMLTGMPWLTAKQPVLLQSEAGIMNARQQNFKLVNHRTFNWVSVEKTLGCVVYLLCLKRSSYH